MNISFSVTDLEHQVSQLEVECERLSQALESQKVSASNAESAARANSEDLSREIARKVCYIPFVELDEPIPTDPHRSNRKSSSSGINSGSAPIMTSSSANLRL